MLAFLEMGEQRWTHGLVEAAAQRRAPAPEERLLALFDVLDEWFHRDDFEACSFINVLLEMGPQAPSRGRECGLSRQHPLDRPALR